jgi:hypothetical protein
VRERPDALFVAPDGFFVSRRVQLTALAARHALPALSGPAWRTPRTRWSGLSTGTKSRDQRR